MNLKTLSFVKLSNFPKNSDFPINALCSPRHSARSEAESQNPKMKMVAGKEDLEGKISPDEEILILLKNPSSSKNQIDPGKILILDFGVVGRG